MFFFAQDEKNHLKWMQCRETPRRDCRMGRINDLYLDNQAKATEYIRQREGLKDIGQLLQRDINDPIGSSHPDHQGLLLNYAVQVEDYHLIKDLITCGAIPSLRDIKGTGKTAVAIAEAKTTLHKHPILSLLQASVSMQGSYEQSDVELDALEWDVCINIRKCSEILWDFTQRLAGCNSSNASRNKLRMN